MINRFFSICALLMLTAPNLMAGWLSSEEAIMGTSVRVELWHDDAKEGHAAVAAVMREMRRIDNAMSPYKPESELSHINREAASRPVVISAELFDLIARSLEFSTRTDGAFDITFSSVGYLYDFRRGVKPTDQQISEKISAINYRHIQLDKNKKTIKYAREGVRIDLGGIAKGYAVDRGVDILKQRGVAKALVTAGGDSRVMGLKNNRPWMIGIRDPRHREGMAAVMPLVDSAISTSGDYERYFEADGVRYHHILNPKTGHSATGVRSVTVIGPDATTTDVLSTSVFILGPTKGMKLVESLPEIEAVIIDELGTMLYSAGLENARREKTNMPIK